MPILDVQKRLRELGRIRMGDKGDKGQPQKLDCWRLTSADKGLLCAAAALYGGEVRPWEGQPGQYELYTTSSELPFVVAPMDLTQWYEQWTKGGCSHRCDGETETITDAPCGCDPDERACKMTTRFSVMLYELPGLGCWRLETHGYYAATELPPTAERLIAAALTGRYIPARLAIEQRTVVRKGQTKRFIVPTIRVDQSLSDVLTGRSALELGGGAIRELPAADADGVVVPALPEPTPEAPKGYLDRTFEPKALQEIVDKALELDVDIALIERQAEKNGVANVDTVLLAIVKAAKK